MFNIKNYETLEPLLGTQFNNYMAEQLVMLDGVSAAKEYAKHSKPELKAAILTEVKRAERAAQWAEAFKDSPED